MSLLAGDFELLQAYRKDTTLDAADVRMTIVYPTMSPDIHTTLTAQLVNDNLIQGDLDDSLPPPPGIISWRGPISLSRINVQRPGPLYVSSSPGSLWRVDTNGAARFIGNMGVTMADIAFSPNGELFGISYGDLYRIDPLTAQSTFRGSSGYENISSLAFDANGTLYFGTFGLTSRLGTLDLETGHATVRPNTVGHTIGGDLAFAPNGDLFACDCQVVGFFDFTCSETASSQLIRIDPATGVGQLRGQIGFPRVYGIDFVGDTLFGVTYQSELISINTQTGTGTLVANTTPTIYATGASSLLNSPPLPPPRLDPQPPPPATKNLVFITHGWNSDGIETIAWVDLMADRIRNDIQNSSVLDPNEWYVRDFHWEERANTGSKPLTGFDKARREGEELGRMLGDAYAGQNYEHVHLIANSAGSGLINEIAKKIWAANPQIEIHMTFLDAYAPIWSDDYGAWTVGGSDGMATWADHYFTDFDTAFLFTQTRLENAHNFNVTYINPSPSPIPDELAHSWPREFYLQTILGINEDSDGTGYPFSLEGGGWDPPLLNLLYPKHGKTDLGHPGATENIARRLAWGSALLDFQAVNHVISGTVDFLQNALGMETSSPVWYTAAIETSVPHGLLRFDLEFTSDVPAEGLFTVYLDNELLGTFDERFAPNGVYQHVFAIGILEPGLHTLSFRLDPFTKTNSSVVISNVQWGLLIETIAADFDEDGDVDMDDFMAWQTGFGLSTAAIHVNGDGDLDGDVDGNDFLIWQASFGTGQQSLPSEINVPEPLALILAVVGLLVIGVRDLCHRVAGLKRHFFLH